MELKQFGLMNKSTALAGGLAGAVTVTLLHESLRHLVDAPPRMDKLGIEAIKKGFKKAGSTPPSEKTLYPWAMAGDVVSNALYYSLTGIGSSKEVWRKGLLIGLAAGLGALVLPKPLGLSAKWSNRTAKTSLLTVGLYLTGALVASAVINQLNKKADNKKKVWEERLVTSAMS